MLNLGTSVLILVSNGAIQRSNRICSQDQSKISPTFVKISPKHQKSTCWNLGMSVLSLVSNGDVQRSFRTCIQGSGQVQSLLTKVPVRSKNIKFGPKWVENPRFGPKQKPNESYGLSGPIRTTPEVKNAKKKTHFSRKTATGTITLSCLLYIAQYFWACG